MVHLYQQVASVAYFDDARTAAGIARLRVLPVVRGCLPPITVAITTTDAMARLLLDFPLVCLFPVHVIFAARCRLRLRRFAAFVFGFGW